MKTRLTQPLQALDTGRVREGLRALSTHVQNAIDLTRLEPVQTSEPELSKDTLPPLPQVDHLTPSKIDFTGRADTATNGIEVIGTDLQKVHQVLLIRSGEVGPKIVSASEDTITHVDGTSLTAKIADLAHAPHGHYNLLLIDEFGQAKLARHAFTIHPPKDTGAAPPPPATLSIQLLPPSGHANQEVPLWVLAKSGSFTNKTTFDIPAELNPKQKWDPLADAAVFEIKIPDHPSKEEYEITVTNEDGTKAVACFRVHRDKDTLWHHMRDDFARIFKH